MRLTAQLCQRKKCNHMVRAGFRLCGKKDCGKNKEEEE